MNLPAGQLVGLAADLEAVEHLLGPLGVVAQVDDHLVVLVEQRDPGVQVGHQQHVAADVEVGRERARRDRCSWCLPSSVKYCSRALARSATTSCGSRPGAVVEPEAVRRLELAGLVAGAAEGPDPLGVLVVLMDVVRAVAVADVKAAVGGEGHVGRAMNRAPACRRRGLRRALP